MRSARKNRQSAGGGVAVGQHTLPLAATVNWTDMEKNPERAKRRYAKTFNGKFKHVQDTIRRIKVLSARANKFNRELNILDLKAKGLCCAHVFHNELIHKGMELMDLFSIFSPVLSKPVLRRDFDDSVLDNIILHKQRWINSVTGSPWLAYVKYFHIMWRKVSMSMSNTKKYLCYMTSANERNVLELEKEEALKRLKRSTAELTAYQAFESKRNSFKSLSAAEIRNAIWRLLVPLASDDENGVLPCLNTSAVSLLSDDRWDASFDSDGDAVEGSDEDSFIQFMS